MGLSDCNIGFYLMKKSGENLANYNPVTHDFNPDLNPNLLTSVLSTIKIQLDYIHNDGKKSKDLEIKEKRTYMKLYEGTSLNLAVVVTHAQKLKPMSVPLRRYIHEFSQEIIEEIETKYSEEVSNNEILDDYVNEFKNLLKKNSKYNQQLYYKVILGEAINKDLTNKEYIDLVGCEDLEVLHQSIDVFKQDKNFRKMIRKVHYEQGLMWDLFDIKPISV